MLSEDFNIPEIDALLASLHLARRVGDDDLANEILEVFQSHEVEITETPEGIRYRTDALRKT